MHPLANYMALGSLLDLVASTDHVTMHRKVNRGNGWWWGKGVGGRGKERGAAHVGGQEVGQPGGWVQGFILPSSVYPTPRVFPHTDFAILLLLVCSTTRTMTHSAGNQQEQRTL